MLLLENIRADPQLQKNRRKRGCTFLVEFTGKLPFGSVGLKAEAGVSLSRGFVVWGINSRIEIYIPINTSPAEQQAGGEH